MTLKVFDSAFLPMMCFIAMAFPVLQIAFVFFVLCDLILLIMLISNLVEMIFADYRSSQEMMRSNLWLLNGFAASAIFTVILFLCSGVFF